MSKSYPPARKRIINVIMLSLTGLCAALAVAVLFFILGYLIWNDFPSRNVWAGAALIIASGLYIFWRERVKQVR